MTHPRTIAFRLSSARAWRRSLPGVLRLALVVTALGGGSMGCGSGGRAPAGDGGSDAGGDGASGDAGDAQGDGSACITFSQVTLFAKCRTCHSSTLSGDARSNATVGVDFDVYESARTQAVLAQRYVSLGLMPPPERNTPATDAEKAGLDEWIACGTPR